jgi:hypothetical protein
MKIIIQLTLFCSLISFISFGQSKLIFQNVKDSGNIYKLPLGKFPVQLQLKDTVAFKAIIDHYADSVLQVNIYARGRVIDSTIFVLNNANSALIKAHHKKRDSLNAELDAKKNHTRYSMSRSIDISKIKTITIYNHYFPSENKKIKWANAACVIFLVGTLVVSPTENPYLIGGGIGLTATAYLIKTRIAIKDLDLIIPKKAKHRKKWKIIGMQD